MSTSSGVSSSGPAIASEESAAYERDTAGSGLRGEFSTPVGQFGARRPDVCHARTFQYLTGYESVGVECDPHYFEMAKSALPRLAAMRIEPTSAPNLGESHRAPLDGR